MRSALALLLLAGCNREPLSQAEHDAETDIAHVTATEAIQESRRVQQLEDRINAQ